MSQDKADPQFQRYYERSFGKDSALFEFFNRGSGSYTVHGSQAEFVAR
eukprot:gene15715-4735_t